MESTKNLEKRLYLKSLEKYKNLGKNQKLDLIEKSKECAREIFDKLKAQKKLDLKDLFKDYKLSIVFNEDEDYNILSFYDKSINELKIYKKTIERYLDLLKAGSDYDFSYDTFLPILLAHEFYHVYEMNEKGVYTFSNLNKRKFLFFSIGGKIPEASEIGANEFSKIYNNLDTSLEILNLLVKNA